MVDGQRVFIVKRPDCRAMQHADMAARAQGFGNVARQRSDIGALAAGDFEHRLLTAMFDQPDRVDIDLARLQLHGLASPRQVIGALAIHLERRIDRWPLPVSCR
ncbi:MAG: hypothetical protein NVV63_12105 [Opitutus sp.]|nr:hypothetical protein [Opitutus sp.]